MLNKYIYSYDNIIIMGDFNCDMNENIEKQLINTFLRNILSQEYGYRTSVF